jgi:hypothetical protein
MNTAHLRLFEGAAQLLRQALESATYAAPAKSTNESDSAAAILLHGMAVRDDAEAIVVLRHARQGNSVITHARGIYEGYAKMRWFANNDTRATRFFKSEPFERYWLGIKSPRLKRRPVWKTVLADCAAAVKADPKLLLFQKAGTPPKRADYIEIFKALRLPEMEEIIKDVDDDADAYVEAFLIPSLTSHKSVNRLRDFATGVKADGSVILDARASDEFVDHYLLKCTPWLLACALLVSAALGTKDVIVPRISAYNVEDVQPAIDSYNTDNAR